jgi:DNA mismatch repair protein MutS2
MPAIDEQTLNDLEFPQLREWLSAYCLGPTAAQKVSQLKPIQQFQQIEQELITLEELRRIRISGESFPALQFEELERELKLLPVSGSVLSLEGYMRISLASEMVNDLLYFFDKRENDFPRLAKICSSAYFTKELIDAINKVFDRAGQVKDDASPDLLKIREQIKVVRNQINKNFEKELRRLSKDNLLAETRETFINERRVLTVISTHKRKISGTIVGSSKTGSLTFIEPQINIQLNNELELVLDDERKEIFLILQQLSRELAAHIDLIQTYQRILVKFDFINAKCKLALELKCCLPGLIKETHIELIDAFHPILWKSNKETGKMTFPQYVKMDRSSRMLVISGPNAGGKSITLKTIGLLQIMLQSGLLVPVNPNSKMCFFQQVLTDIGDNQSIENELSTYSYRLKRMQYFLTVSNQRTLLLLDEFGTGSDPDLGGALAEVFFEELYNKRSFGVITTHYGNIKLKADKLKEAVNGCMLFNTETLEPLYRFSIGQPGSSFTFEVAQINGIPLELIERAKSRIDQRKLKMDQLLHELQREKTYLEKLNKEHIVAQDSANKAREDFLERKARFEEKLRAQQEFIEKNNKFLQNGKKLSAFIEKFVTRSRKKDANQPLFEEIRKYLAVEKSKLEDADRKEKLIKASQTTKPKKKKIQKPESDPYQRHRIVVGSIVKLISTKQSGTVESIEGENLTVTFGFVRMKVERDKLTWVQG